MDRLKEVLSFFINIDKEKIMYEVLEEYPRLKDLLIELNQNQLRNNIDSNNRFLGNNIDLYETGRFYSTFRVNNKLGRIEIVADTNLYSIDFKDKYSEDIIGLTKESLDIFESEFRIYLLEYIKNKLHI